MQNSYTNIQKTSKIFTKNENGDENGYVLPLAKIGRWSTAYISVFYPKCFRGYHIHTERTNHIYCLKGEVVIHTKNPTTGNIDIIPLSEDSEEMVTIAPHTPTAIENIGLTNAHVLFVPEPAYDPTKLGEMMKASREDVERQPKILIEEEGEEE